MCFLDEEIHRSRSFGISGSYLCERPKNAFIFPRKSSVTKYACSKI